MFVLRNDFVILANFLSSSSMLIKTLAQVSNWIDVVFLVCLFVCLFFEFFWVFFVLFCFFTCLSKFLI